MDVNELAYWILRTALEARSAVEEYQPKWEALSPREREVAELFRGGLEMEDIAKDLMISKETMAL